MSQVAREPGRWTLWVAGPAAALIWLIREAWSRRPAFVAKIAERLAAERAELVPPDVRGVGFDTAAPISA